MHRIARGAAAMLFLAWLSAAASEPPGYYANAEGKTGAQLRSVLHEIIKGHRVIPYSSGATNTADALKVLEANPNDTNSVLLIYSRASQFKVSFGLPGGWNREHLWPNSYGLDGHIPAYSDLHNLRAEDSNVNSARGNKFYDVSDTNSPNYSFPAHIEAPLASTDTDSWEPPAEVKGDVARAVFYMIVRYTGDVGNEPALVLTDTTGQISSSTNLMGRLTTLLLWHIADPVDAKEQHRNDLIFEFYQGNRNPFVDRPEWVHPAFLPTLAFTQTGAEVRLQWAAEYSAAKVEAAQMPNAWATITSAPTLTNGLFTMILPVNSPQRFFRLRLE